MSHYRRSLVAGGTYFFTIALVDRQSGLLINEIDKLRTAYKKVINKWPFETVAICILPEHLHAIWTLPTNDSDYATRWQHFKRWFSLELPAASERSQSKMNRREKGLWQRRYWEHLIRDENDLRRHIDYVYHNPVKHGLVNQVKDWPFSSFHRDVQRGIFSLDWGCDVEDLGEGFGE